MSSSKRKVNMEDVIAMLGDDEVSETLLSDMNLKPSRSLADLLLLMLFLEKREQRIKTEIVNALASAQNDEIRKMFAERMIKMMDRMEESMDAMTSLMSIFFTSIAGKSKKEKLQVKIE